MWEGWPVKLFMRLWGLFCTADRPSGQKWLRTNKASLPISDVEPNIHTGWGHSFDGRSAWERERASERACRQSSRRRTAPPLLPTETVISQPLHDTDLSQHLCRRSMTLLMSRRQLSQACLVAQHASCTRIMGVTCKLQGTAEPPVTWLLDMWSQTEWESFLWICFIFLLIVKQNLKQCLVQQPVQTHTTKVTAHSVVLLRTGAFPELLQLTLQTLPLDLTWPRLAFKLWRYIQF